MKMFILHGWTYQTATWDAARALLDQRNIDYDLLHIPGLTDGMNPIWTLDEYVRWLEEKTAGHDRVVLWGHSNGGRISLAFAAQHPEKVARLILEDSAGIPPRGVRKLKREVFRKLSEVLGGLVPSGNLRGTFRRAIGASDYANATPEMRTTMANLLAVDLRAVLGRIRCPTLIIWGARDMTTPLADGELMHARIRGSRMIVLPDARHSPHITHTAEVAQAVQDFIRSV